MNNTAKIGVAVASGYLMGRSRKAKLAFALGTWMMGKRLSLDARKLAREGITALTSSPDLARITDDVRNELVDAGRAAAMSMVTGRVEKLADSLHQRTAALTGAEPEPSEPEGEPRDSAEGVEEGAEGRRGEPEKPRRTERPVERQGSERPRRSAVRGPRQPVTKEGQRPAPRAGSTRRQAGSEEPPPRRPRSDAGNRRAPA